MERWRDMTAKLRTCSRSASLATGDHTCARFRYCCIISLSLSMHIYI